MDLLYKAYQAYTFTDGTIFIKRYGSSSRINDKLKLI